MNINRVSSATSMASNEPTYANSEVERDYKQWVADIDKLANPHAAVVERSLAAGKPVQARVPSLPRINEDTPPVASPEKRFVFGMSVLLGFAVMPVAISSLALGPVGVGIAGACLLGALALHALANRMK